MGRALVLIAFLVVAFGSVRPCVAAGVAESVRLARALQEDACKLHQLLEVAGADPFAMRSVCRLESAAGEMVEKLSCGSHLAEAGELLDECILWYGRTSVAVRRDCRLADDRAIAATVSCAGRQLALLEESIACLLRHGGGHVAPINPFQQPTWIAPPTGYGVPRGWPQARPVQPGAWQSNAWQSNARQPDVWRAEGGQPESWANTPWGQGAESQFAPLESRFVPPVDARTYRQSVPNSPPSSPQRGQIARAVLELMLSEMSR